MWLALGISMPIAALSGLLAPSPYSSIGFVLAAVVCVFVAANVTEDE